jgi:hypothetical protein
VAVRRDKEFRDDDDMSGNDGECGRGVEGVSGCGQWGRQRRKTMIV